MPREYSVSEDVLKIISTFFVDGCYVFQVVEKFMEMHPELTIKQARVKADKSMRFLERKGLLQSKHDEGGTRKYELLQTQESVTQTNCQTSEKAIQKLREKCKALEAEARAAHLEWEYLIKLKKNPEISVISDIRDITEVLCKEAEQNTLLLTAQYSALEKVLSRLNVCV